MSEWFWKRLDQASGWIAGLVLFGVIGFTATIEIKDLDLWLHLAAGKYILSHGSIPQVDIFSSTIAGAPWIDHEWLFQVIVYSVYRLTGVNGLLGLQVLMVVLTSGLVFSFLSGRASSPEKKQSYQFAGLVLLFLILLVYKLRFTLRPDLFSLLFFVTFLRLLTSHVHKKYSLGLVFLTQVLWSNMHGFFILGPVLILMAMSAELAKRHLPLPFEWGRVRRLKDEDMRRLGQMFVISLLACLINPYFIRGVAYPLSVFFSLSGESKIFFEYISELKRPLTWNTLFSLEAYLPFKGLVVISLFSFLFNRRRVDVTVLLFWVFSLVFSLCAVRNIVFFAFTAFLAVMSNLRQEGAPQTVFRKTRNIKLFYLGLILLKSLMIGGMLSYAGEISLRGYFDFDTLRRKSEFGGFTKRNFPYKAVDWLVEQRIRGNFLNDFNSGAYLVGRAFPRVRVFIDGRTEMYGEAFFNAYRKVWSGDPQQIAAAIRQYHLTGAFLNSSEDPVPGDLLRYFYENKEWVLVYFDYDAAIFLKDVPENQWWIDHHAVDLPSWKFQKMDLFKVGLKKITPYPYFNRAEAFLKLSLWDKAEEEINEALRINPHHPDPYRLLGQIHVKRKEWSEAFEDLRKAKLLAPGDMRVRYLLGVALCHLGELPLAREQALRLRDHDPKNPNGMFLSALIYAKEQRHEDALAFLAKAHHLVPENAQEILRIGDVLFEQRAFAQAKVAYRLALATGRSLKKVRKKLYLCADALGNTPPAGIKNKEIETKDNEGQYLEKN